MKGISLSGCFMVSRFEAACTLNVGMLDVVLCCLSDSTEYCAIPLPVSCIISQINL